MKSKYNSERMLANLLRSAVEKETPDVKNKVMASVRSHEDNKATVPQKTFKRPLVKYAVSFALVVLVLGGAIVIPKSIMPSVEPAAKSPSQSTKSTALHENKMTMAQENPFVLKAYAAENTGNSSVAGGSSSQTKSFGLSLTRPVDIYGKKFTNSFFTSSGASYYEDYNVLKEDGDNLIMAEYVGFNLKCVGQHIKSITYQTNRGGFSQIKPISEQEFRHIGDTIPYLVHWREDCAKNDKSGSIPHDIPNPNYGNGKTMEVPNRGVGENFYGFLPVGTSYTLHYVDQDNYAIQYACRVTKAVSKKEYEDPNTDLRKIPHEMKKAADGTVVTITATYEDGSEASKQCVMKLDTYSWSFRAVEK